MGAFAIAKSSPYYYYHISLFSALQRLTDRVPGAGKGVDSILFMNDRSEILVQRRGRQFLFATMLRPLAVRIVIAFMQQTRAVPAHREVCRIAA